MLIIMISNRFHSFEWLCLCFYDHFDMGYFRINLQAQEHLAKARKRRSISKRNDQFAYAFPALNSRKPGWFLNNKLAIPQIGKWRGKTHCGWQLKIDSSNISYEPWSAFFPASAAWVIRSSCLTSRCCP